MTESQYGCVRYWRHLCGFSVCVFIWLCTMSIYWDVYIVCTHICLLYIYMSRCVSEHMCIHHVHFYVYLQKQSHDHERLCSYLRGLLACVVCLSVLTRDHMLASPAAIAGPPVCWCMRPSEIRSEWYPWHPGSFNIPAEPKHTFSTQHGSSMLDV